MERPIIETGESFLSKLSQSDEDIDRLFRKMENDNNLEDRTMQVGVPLWLGLPCPTLKFPA